VPRFGSRNRNTTRATRIPGSADTNSAQRHPKAMPSQPPSATPTPVPTNSMTIWMENALPRRSGG
jgi:hypothetical protein